MYGGPNEAARLAQPPKPGYGGVPGPKRVTPPATAVALAALVLAAPAGAATPLGGDFRISTVGSDTDTDRRAADAAVAYNSSADEYLVVWEGDDHPLANNVTEIFGRRVSAAGVPIGDDFR